MKSCLLSPQQFYLGPVPLGKGNAYESDEAFVLVDGNYISARWPGDAYLFATKFVEKLLDKKPSSFSSSPKKTSVEMSSKKEQDKVQASTVNSEKRGDSSRTTKFE